MPRVWPLWLNSCAWAASDSGRTVSTCVLTRLSSISRPISANCAAFGAAEKNAPRAPCAGADWTAAGSTIETKMPPGFRTPQERPCVSPPIVSNTTSTLFATSSNRAAV